MKLKEKTVTPKDVGDLAAGSAAFGSVFNYLPEVAALLAIVWTGIRIFEWARVRILRRPPDSQSPDLEDPTNL